MHRFAAGRGGRQVLDMMKKLRYGNTNTFFVDGLLVDTDYAGTLGAFYRELKRNGLGLADIKYVLATHWHPDHAGLIGELQKQGVKLLLIDVQKDSVHFPDRIFEKDGLAYVKVDETKARVISCGESRDFLAELGIDGEIVHTPSHSPDSVTLILDNGDCFAGDLELFEYVEAYGPDERGELEKDRETVLAHMPKRIFYAHRPEILYAK